MVVLSYLPFSRPFTEYVALCMLAGLASRLCTDCLFGHALVGLFLFTKQILKHLRTSCKSGMREMATVPHSIIYKKSTYISN